MGPTADLEKFIEDKYHPGLEAFGRGDPEPNKRLFSRSEVVTLANPFGPPVRGWREVSEVMDRASSVIREGEVLGFDRVSTCSTGDVAWTIELERYRMKVGGAAEPSPVSLRVTTIFRREDGDWLIAHRHADPITTARPPESLIQD
jgi:ketosteroid isomerase-like protein